jgi:hypothetical protein
MYKWVRGGSVSGALLYKPEGHGFDQIVSL